MSAKKRQKISKAAILRKVATPLKDFYMEKIDLWTYKLHFTPFDAIRSHDLLDRYFDVENAGKGYYGSAYIVRNRLECHP